ncbi:MAG: hypothetical protein KG012_01295 [Deltaproteobacteria bacterium]|nr:hypothetical protein [Deltaproteobacteria bacterium]
MKTRTFLSSVSLIPFIILLFSQFCFGLTDEEIQKFQSLLKAQPVGERIAFWAERFVGTPYDKDPMGEYVTRATIVADERVDCMYLTFRAVELALSRTPEEAIQIAIERRFHSKGILKDGKVVNYEDRFEYGEDMIFSGRWGREITSETGKTIRIKGARGKDFVEILPSEHLLKGLSKLKSGDILFFVKKPEDRKLEEIVGHIGIVKVGQAPYLIHASGTKGKGGEVKKVLLKDYILKMPFIGAKITRFD